MNMWPTGNRTAIDGRDLSARAHVLDSYPCRLTASKAKTVKQFKSETVAGMEGLREQ